MMQEDPGAGATAQGAGQAGELPPLPMPGPGREDRHGAAPGAPAGDPGEVPPEAGQEPPQAAATGPRR